MVHRRQVGRKPIDPWPTFDKGKASLSGIRMTRFSFAEWTYRVDEKTKYWLDGKAATWDDVKVGLWALIDFHKDGYRNIADTVKLTPSKPNAPRLVSETTRNQFRSLSDSLAAQSAAINHASLAQIGASSIQFNDGEGLPIRSLTLKIAISRVPKGAATKNPPVELPGGAVAEYCQIEICGEGFDDYIYCTTCVDAITGGGIFD